MNIDTTKARVYRINEISVGDKFYVASVVDTEIGNSDLIGEVIEVGSKYQETIWTKCCNFMTLEAYYLIKIEEENMKKEFTKADMKDGMRCILRNGDQMFWNAEGDENPMIQGSKYMGEYDDECISYDLLNSEKYAPSDIMEVYALGELVWKREEESEEQKKLKEIYLSIEKLQEEAKAIVERK